MGECAAERRFRSGTRATQHRIAHLFQQLRCAALVENLELRRHIRLERKTAKQALAKGMNGLDLESARRLDRASEEAASRRQLRIIWCNAFNIGKRQRQFPVGHDRPSAKTIV